MSDLTSNFDVLRGHPDGSALVWDFLQDSGAASDIAEGTVVAVVAASSPTSVDRHTSALIGPNTDNYDRPWLVIRGYESSESEFTGRLSCAALRKGIVFKVATLLTPAVGDLLWADDGVLTNVDPGAGKPHLGKVIAFDSDNGVMTVES